MSVAPIQSAPPDQTPVPYKAGGGGHGHKGKSTQVNQSAQSGKAKEAASAFPNQMARRLAQANKANSITIAPDSKKKDQGKNNSNSQESSLMAEDRENEGIQEPSSLINVYALLINPRLGRYSLVVPEAVTRGELRPSRNPKDEHEDEN